MTERLKRGKDFFITSDTWFGRPQILQIANRLQFKDIDEMNQVLIKNWNGKVKKNDTNVIRPQNERNTIKGNKRNSEKDDKKTFTDDDLKTLKIMSYTIKWTPIVPR